ncbi:MAG: PolC-type DNA polymerase III [Clostridiales bacterium]|nr:PolC-type DNA polymerase III [Clostridiales bacterium]
MLFFEAFEMENIPQDLKGLFEEVEIVRLTMNQKSRCVNVHVNSSHLLFTKDRRKMEGLLKKQIFQNAADVLTIREHYVLSAQYTPKNILDIYLESLLEEWQEERLLDYHILRQADCRMEGNCMILSCGESRMVHSRENEIRTALEEVWKERFDLKIAIQFEYHEVEKKKDPDVLAYEKLEAAGGWNPEKPVSAPAPEQEKKEEVKTVSAEKHSGEKYSYKSKYRKLPQDPDIFYGRAFDGAITPISEIQDEIGEVVIQGEIIKVEERELRNEKILLMFHITDYTDTIGGKLFLRKEQADEVREYVKKGNCVCLKGMALYDKFDHEVGIASIVGMKKAAYAKKEREDHSEKKRVELHAHTIMSNMDGLTDIKAMVKTAKKWGHKAIAITDHGCVQAFPEANHAIDPDEPFKVIYGVEAYLVDDLQELVLHEEGQSLDDPCVVFDIETTGLDSLHCEIIEIGAVKVVNGKITERFSEFINPKVPIPYKITELTSITDEMVMDAPGKEVVLPQFLDFCKDCVLVAHNASFDVGFITEKAKEMGISTHFTVMDTVTLAHVLLPQLNRYKLDTVCKELNISLENHHRAVDDAGATAEIFVKFIEMLKERNISTLKEVNELSHLSADTIKKLPTYHAIILAQNDLGRVNLYRLVTDSNLKYFAKRPRIPKSEFIKHREGLLIGSACEAGELYQALLLNHTDEEVDRLARFYDYYEIQPLANNRFMIDSDRYEINSDEDLIEINKKIVGLGERYNKLVVATCDVHFLNPEDEIYRRIVLSNHGFKDTDRPNPLYLRTTEEMLEEFMYLGAEKAEEVVITNTNKIADMIEKISPVYPDKCAPVIPNSDETLRKICYDKATSMYGPDLPAPVSERLEKELKSIIGNGFAVMYIIAQKLVWKSNEDGYLVGSRGSVGSSFVATMSGITEVNPLPAHYYCDNCFYSDFDSEEVKAFAGKSGCDMPDKICPKCGKPLKKDGHEIPFETFLGFYGDKEPDIDLNFSGEYQSKAHAYTEVIFGKGQTFRAGTIGSLAEKTAFGYVKHYFEDRGIHKRNAEIERLAEGCVGVKRTTGQHPGGIVVMPLGYEISLFTPAQHPADDMTTNIITTHFDYHSIDHNLLKLDILGHDDPTMIRMLEDLTGMDAKKIRLDDQKVLSLFDNLSALKISKEDLDGCDLGSLGIPEFGTEFVMQMLRDTRPKTFSDLVRISGLSHGTDVWLGNAQYYIQNGDCTLSTAICTRDDIMTFLIHTGVEKGLAFKIMESVRKGKGLKPEMEEAMKEAGVPEWYMESCRKIKYMFPKAHAAAYVMMAFRIAYFKVYMPLAYYAAYFSIRATAFNYELMCMGRDKLEFHASELKRKQASKEISKKEEDVLKDMKIVREMYARGFEFVPIDIYSAKAKHFQIVGDKLMPSLSTIDGMGDKAAIQVEEEAKKGRFLSRDDFKNRCKVSQTVVDAMGEMGLLEGLPHSNQMSLMDFI